jgi:hypothetical protein
MPVCLSFGLRSDGGGRQQQRRRQQHYFCLLIAQFVPAASKQSGQAETAAAVEFYGGALEIVFVTIPQNETGCRKPGKKGGQFGAVCLLLHGFFA